MSTRSYDIAQVAFSRCCACDKDTHGYVLCYRCRTLLRACSSSITEAEEKLIAIQDRCLQSAERGRLYRVNLLPPYDSQTEGHSRAKRRRKQS